MHKRSSLGPCDKEMVFACHFKVLSVHWEIDRTNIMTDGNIR